MGMLSFADNYSLNIVVDGILIIVLLSLHLSIALDDFWNKKKVYIYFRFFIYLVIVFMAIDILISFGTGYAWDEIKMNALYIIYYATGESIFVSGILVLYAFIEERKETDKKEKKIFLTVITAANAAGTVLIAIQNLRFTGTEYFNITSGIFLIINTIINLLIYGKCIIKYREALKKNEFISLITSAGVIALISFIDIRSGVFINVALSAFIIITYMQILNGRKIKYLREHEELVEKNAELAEANNSIMISQIQPHFIYNTLNSIASLCKLDPDMAQKVTIDFARYLRVNMDSLKNSEPVEFAKEMEHVKTYLEIEKIRFGEYLNVEMDIQTDSFRIPALALQPIVENAVKHGLCKKDDPGTVKISSMEEDDGYVIIVEDDGVGFDTTAAYDDGRKHIGIENVRGRLASHTGGTLEIESTPGEGTKATIFIPKREEEKN